jgi:methionyl-tRNA synthetase
MLNLEKISWSEFGGEILAAGHQLNPAELLFAKIEDAEIQAQVDKLNPTKAANEAAAAEAAGTPAPLPQKEECTFDDFMKMDIRTATVLEAVKVPKTDKLLQLTIDTGIDTRTIVSGIAEHYTPEEMVGKQICILANLAPRKIKGIESRGMILMAKDESGKMRFVTPAEAVDNGACVG